jgi:hypothetical protein
MVEFAILSVRERMHSAAGRIKEISRCNYTFNLPKYPFSTQHPIAPAGYPAEVFVTPARQGPGDIASSIKRLDRIPTNDLGTADDNIMTSMDEQTSPTPTPYPIDVVPDPATSAPPTLPPEIRLQIIKHLPFETLWHAPGNRSHVVHRRRFPAHEAHQNN